MAAAAAVLCEHLPDGGIHWLRVKLHREMRPASHRHICMVVKIVVDLPAFFVASILLLATTIS